MKRTLVAAAGAGLLLAGCATGDTGHLEPEISPDLVGPRSTQEPDQGSGASDDDEGESPEPTASGEPGNPVQAALEEGYGDESWYADVTGVDPADDTVTVTTRLRAGDAAAVEVCEAVVDAAEQSGIASPTVLVRDVAGETIAGVDAAAGETGCSA